MEKSNKIDSVYSVKIKAGKRRTYFFDVRKTKGNDYFVTLTESTRKYEEDGYERHKIFLYKEDFNRFVNGLTEAINHVKNDLMPEYDYEEYERRQLEWEAQKAAENKLLEESNDTAVSTESATSDSEEAVEDDLSW